MLMELHTIIIDKLLEDHPYWRERTYVGLLENDWGPSPTLDMMAMPQTYSTVEEAQAVIDRYNVYGIKMSVATLVFKRRSRTRKKASR